MEFMGLVLVVTIAFAALATEKCQKEETKRVCLEATKSPACLEETKDKK